MHTYVHTHVKIHSLHQMYTYNRVKYSHIVTNANDIQNKATVTSTLLLYTVHIIIICTHIHMQIYKIANTYYYVHACTHQTLHNT